jgi:methylenetetrahydrofolate reductase (NADPH)
MGKIHEKVLEGRSMSFEFFPPKTDEAQRVLIDTLRDLEQLKPSFVSVTYGAGGTTRDRTHDLIVGLMRTTHMAPMAHLTCAGHTRLDLAEILVRYARAGLKNLLALGGDPPKELDVPEGDLRYAEQLVELAHAIGDFSIGIAAHPEGHPASPDLATDRKHLARKLALADFAVTQFFFDVDHYLSMVNELSDLGVDKPVIPGVMPIINVAGIAKMSQMSGATMPARLMVRLEKAERLGGQAEVYKVGVEAATELSQELLDAGAPGLHFYTMNRSGATLEIFKNLATEDLIVV